MINAKYIAYIFLQIITFHFLIKSNLVHTMHDPRHGCKCSHCYLFSDVGLCSIRVLWLDISLQCFDVDPVCEVITDVLLVS